jgi:tetratricopeptide (TPR) repeat protein
MTKRFGRRNLGAVALAALFLPAFLPGKGAFAATSAEELEPSGLAGTYLAARTADVDKDIPSAAAFYRAALQSDPDSLFLLERALILTAASGDVEQALGFAGQLVEKAPTSHVSRLVMAVDQIRAGKFSEAVATLEDSGGGVLADLTGALLVAWARAGEGETDKALADLAALEGEEWYEPFKLLHSGYIALVAGRTDEALKFFEQSRELDPNAVRITEGYARTLAVDGREEEAAAALEDFLLRFPDNALASAALAEIRTSPTQAATVDTPAEGAAEALAGLGAAVGQEGGLEAASLYLRLSLYLDADTAGGLAALSLGNLLDTNGQGEAAIEVFESIPTDQPFRALGALRAALALDRMDRTEEAEVAFKEALRRAPDDVQAYISYGNMLRGRERFAEAAEVYSRAIDRIAEPGAADWSLFYFRGIAFERTQQWERAEADFRQALALHPDQPLVLNYLGYSLVDMGLNLDEALDMIRKAVELRPNDGYIVDSLGWAYYRLGRYEEAVTELERAVSLRADDPVIHDHLGDAYWKAGRTLEAQFQWRHARDFGAEGEELELILKKIAEGKLIEEQRDASLYTVQPGDSLWTISAALLTSGDAYQRLLDANRDQLQSPDEIYPGMQLRIPGNI